jgi:ABC-type multidrug transport system fused ATPase/permease subunit
MNRGTYILAGATVFLSAVFDAVGMGLILPLIGSILSIGDDSNLSKYASKAFESVGVDYSLSNISYIFLLFIILRGVFAVAKDAIINYVSYSFRKLVTLRINHALYTMHMNDFYRQRHGKFLSDIGKQTELAMLYVQQLFEFVAATFSVSMFIAVMLMVDPHLSIGIIMFGLIIGFCVKYPLALYSKRVGVKEVEYNQAMMSDIAEYINSMKSFRSNGLLNYQLTRVRINFERMISLLLKWDIISASIMPLIEILLAIAFVAALTITLLSGGDELMKQLFPVLSTLLVLTHRLYQRLSRLSICFMAIKKYSPSFERVGQYTPEVSSAHYVSVPKPCSEVPEIEFRHVSVSDGRGGKLLNDVSIKFEFGKFYGIMGATGCGKSTLIDLMLLFRNFDDGMILMRGQDISSYGPEQLREKIGLISQNETLTQGTIIDCVRGARTASDNVVTQFCRSLSFLDFINSLPEGFSTKVGERGSLISGGQAQRIAIARMLFRDPEILVLDESTSGLDVNTEREVYDVLKKLTTGKTLIAISHRPSALSDCDEIFRIDNSFVISSKTERVG